MTKKEKIRNAKSYDELLDIKYGKIGTQKRDRFEERAQYFVISEMLKEARQKANLTQEQLAEKVGTKQSAIARFESGTYNPSLSFVKKLTSALHLKLKVYV